VLFSTVWAIFYLVFKRNENVIQLVVDSGIGPKIVSILARTHDDMAGCPISRNLHEIAMWTSLAILDGNQVPAVLGCDSLRNQFPCLWRYELIRPDQDSSRVLIIYKLLNILSFAMQFTI